MNDAASPVVAYLTKARIRGERWVSAARAGIAVLIALRVLFASIIPQGRVARESWLMLGVVAFGFAGSLVAMRLVRVRAQESILTASVTLDVLVIFAAQLIGMTWPLPSFQGLLCSPEPGIFLVAIAASVLRFSSRLSGLSIALSLISFGVLLCVDRVHSAAYPSWVWADATVYFVAASVIAVAATRRGLRLISEGAQAALNAERARQRFGAYVSAEIADAALSKDELTLGGDRHHVAVLFSDLRGFTKYAEHLAPETLVTELNGYLDAMLPIIAAEGGVVDKYIGDSIMVVFGVPAPHADDAVRAIKTARGMQRALREHNRQRYTRGMGPLVQGIGVHYGPVVAGNIGTPERLQYTVIGDTVNLSSRLESATKEHGVAVLISEAAVTAARDTGNKLPALKSLGSISVRGRAEMLEVFCFPDDGFSHEISIDPVSAEQPALPPK